MTEVLPFSLTTEWLPLWKTLGCFFATFVLEDVAAVGAGLLLATGEISWLAAFIACFFGIWLGDVGLYALARYGGRNWFERSAFKKFSTKVARHEKWFAERGTPILIFSRVVPGARLPTYLAAGFLRVPLPRFLAITGAAAFIWTWLILWLAQTFGERLLHWLGSYRASAGLLFIVGLILILALQLLRRTWLKFNPIKIAARFGRWTRWEFWPLWLFYPPVAIYYLWLAVKYRSTLLPTAANPGIFSGGIVGESKMATLKELFATSPEFTAEAILVSGNNFAERQRSVAEIAAQFICSGTGDPPIRLDLQTAAETGPAGRQSHYGTPFILKPDIGQRGVGIKLIRTRAQAENYLRQTAAPLVAQRYAPGPFEAGIFYYRFPGAARGQIFSITEKVFPIVTGDGKSTVAELVWRDERARFIAEKYLQRLGARQETVLPAGETLKLVEAGNHAQGCIFRDGRRLNSPALGQRIDEISKKLDGFFIGRYDLRFASEDDLRAGKNFSIIELNGAAAEAASIYDARNSLWSAYRTLFRQWDLVFAIGAENRRRGFQPMKLAPLWRAWRGFAALEKTYPAAD